MMRIKNTRKVIANDVIDVLLRDVPLGSRVYGREDEPGVVVIRDTVTDDIYGLTITCYWKYPDIWKQSLMDLGMGALIEQLQE